jgi:hypothetical protein
VDFFNVRRPSPLREGDGDRPLDRDSLTEANARIRASAPAYRADAVNTKIRTTAVQRHRARRAGGDDFGTVGEYVNFICGTED